MVRHAKCIVHAKCAEGGRAVSLGKHHNSATLGLIAKGVHWGMQSLANRFCNLLIKGFGDVINGNACIGIAQWSAGDGSSVDHGSKRSRSAVSLSKIYHSLPNFSILSWWLSIWLLMAQQSDVYIKDAELCIVSPPILWFSIRPLLTMLQCKTFQKCHFSHVLDHDVIGIRRIENRRMGGESTHDFA